MITTGGGISAVIWLSHFIQQGPTPSAGGGGSQTPAIIAVILAVISGLATLISVYRQTRNERVANDAVHSTAANQANELSFKQLMGALERSDAENKELRSRIDVLEDEKDEWEMKKTKMEGELRRLGRKNEKLTQRVTELENSHET